MVFVRRALAALAIGAGCGTGAAAQELAVTRVRLDSLPQLGALARQGFEVSSVMRDGDALFALVVATDVQRLALGIGGLEAARVPLAPTAPAVFFRDNAAIQTTLEALAAGGGPVTLDTIGYSWEGRPILAVKIGPAGDAPERPNVLYIGTHHAREWIAAEVATRLAEYLVDSLPATASGAALLATRDVWVVPVLNPDGYQYSFDVERFWRKNRRNNGDGTFGVDLNRNYPGFWGFDNLGSSPTTGAETYRGPAAGSEPELQALIAFHAAHPPDVSISYHSYTGLILYPYGFASGRLNPDARLFSALAGTPLAPAILERLPETSRPLYFPGPSWMLYPTNGEYTEWAYRTHRTVAYTVELTAGCCVGGVAYGFDFPDDSAAISQVFRDNLPFALDLLQFADSGSGTVPPPRLESLWPEIRLVGPPAGATRSVQVRDAAGTTARTLTADSLDQGRRFWRWRGPLGADPGGVRVSAPDLMPGVRMVLHEGAEGAADGWSGWQLDSTVAVEGRRSWRSAADTMVSPVIAAPGVSGATLVFWTRHGGSLFLPDRFGLVEISRDGGATWTTLERLDGSAPEWYPLTIPLGSVDGARIRFVPRNFPWYVDAIHIYGTAAGGEIVVAQGQLGVSENPVRSDRVFFSWAAATGDTRLSVFTFAGELVHRATVPAGTGVVAWDLTNGAGQAVDNGVYLAVLELGGEVLRKRLFVARSR